MSDHSLDDPRRDPAQSTPGDDTDTGGDDLAPLLECLLLMAEEPLDAATLAQASGSSPGAVEAALAGLVEEYRRGGRGFQLRTVAGGWSYATRPEFHDRIANWVRSGGQNRLSQAAMETLAVIAYLQPVARARVSAVRGVAVDAVVRTLLRRGLIDEQGSDEHTGAGLLVTTDHFLARLGLNSLSELPDIAPLLPDASALEAELAQLARPPREGQADDHRGNRDDEN
ncbi:segregation and condensation protein B [Propionibacterium cyclohexanicum]|uniref:Segregation and condensation protein B n=1 Tax=Propionibacterium cyclohexanicum TaxID=64702 RepID=A0A1H9QVV2_9ACTN|nr:SMC-Scp complex subunit ScpB [Propionibacterium cyclohexanicum]SER63823.1 segregation and condensation protein B [Propionibacterium cyclohexanicum]